MSLAEQLHQAAAMDARVPPGTLKETATALETMADALNTARAVLQVVCPARPRETLGMIDNALRQAGAPIIELERTQ